MFRALVANASAPPGSRIRGWARALRPAGLCAVCRAWQPERVCQACVQRFAPRMHRCELCALPLASAEPRCGACQRALLNARPHHQRPLDACHAAVPYAFPWDGLLARFKYHGDPGLAAALAACMLQAQGVHAALGGADVLLPVPVSDERLAQRGFNQSLLLARALRALHPAPPVQPRWLRRRPGPPPQATLDRSARLRNLRDAFELAPDAHVIGLRVLLVDDVMTTGATLLALASVLRRAGAARVEAVVLARAERH